MVFCVGRTQSCVTNRANMKKDHRNVSKKEKKIPLSSPDTTDEIIISLVTKRTNKRNDENSRMVAENLLLSSGEMSKFDDKLSLFEFVRNCTSFCILVSGHQNALAK